MGRTPVLALALLVPALGVAAPRPSLAVAAAANLRPALDTLARAFEAERPGVEVRVTFAASGTLHAQIVAGAPFDVFFSADRASPRALAAEGLAEREEVYALGRLAVWVPNGSPLDLARDGLAALARPGVRRVAIAEPRARAVRARRRGGAARRGGLGGGPAEARPRRERRADGAVRALPAPRTRRSCRARSRSLPALAAAGRAVDVPHPPVEQGAAVLARARDPALARAFLAFVRGEKGRALLTAAGYGLP